MAVLEKEAVSQALVDSAHDVSAAAQKLGVPFMELDAFIDEHPTLRSMVRSVAPAPADVEVMSQNQMLPAEIKGTNQSVLNVSALTLLLKTAGVRQGEIQKHVHLAEYYRLLETGSADVINSNAFVNYLEVKEICGFLKERIIRGNYEQASDEAKDHTAMAKYSKLLIEHQQVLLEANLTSARVNKLLADAQQTKSLTPGSQQPPQQGKAAWPRKEKQNLVQINTSGDVNLHGTTG